MNKVLIGLFILVVGGFVGWYYFGGNTSVPGMKIGDTNVSPAPKNRADEDVSISDEPTIVGTEKGGVIEEGVVVFTDNGYLPATITVKKGTTVTFRNESVSGMWTASDTHPSHQILPGFDQKKSVAKGGTYEFTFAKIGTWKYHNHIKPEITGMVVVTE